MKRHPAVFFYLLAISCIAGTWTARGQTAVTGWSLNVTSGTSQTTGGITYQGYTSAITSFSTGFTPYELLPGTANAVYVRRNINSDGDRRNNEAGQDNNNRSSTWYTEATSSTVVYGSYNASLGGVLLGNNTLMGGDNLFSNSNNTSTLSAGNIERVDFVWTSGLTVTSGAGLTVFDRGVSGQHDSFKIAAFTNWSSSQAQPTTYSGNIVSVNSSHYGANLDYDPFTAGTQAEIDSYRILRYNAGDNLGSRDGNDAGTNQGIAGAFISFADLGIAVGTTIYGYSLMASDVTASIGNLADWNNATYYPTNTPDSAGGLDLMSFNGRVARPVPEPSTYGAILVALGLVGYAARRRSLRTR